MKSTDILRKYTNGQMSLQEANAALKECRAGVHLDPQRNYIHPGEKDLYGLLDTGTGYMDKALMVGGQLVHADCGDMVAYFIQNGTTYKVKGNKVIEE